MFVFSLHLLILSGSLGSCSLALAEWSLSVTAAFFQASRPTPLVLPTTPAPPEPKPSIANSSGDYAGDLLAGKSGLRIYHWMEPGHQNSAAHGPTKALKLRSEEDWFRIRREAWILRRLQSLNFVPRIFEDYRPGQLIGTLSAGLILEWIEGQNIQTESILAAESTNRMEKRRRLKQILEDAISISEMIDAIHAQGFYVLDIKPANIVRSQRGLRLIDLETAKPLGLQGIAAEEPRSSRRGALFFSDSLETDFESGAYATALYGAPEVFTNCRDWNKLRDYQHLHYFDYYSLAALIMELAIRSDSDSLSGRARKAWETYSEIPQPNHKIRDKVIAGFHPDISKRFNDELCAFLSRLTHHTDDYPSRVEIRSRIRGLIALLSSS